MCKVAQWFLYIFGLLLLGYWAEAQLRAKWSQTEGAQLLERPGSFASAPHPGDVVAKLEIPRVSLSTIAFEGDGQDILARGAGHISGSALPGERGNAVFAAHRDTFFRPLRSIRVGDVVSVETPGKKNDYVVEFARVVEPDEVDVLRPTSEPALTLITCYPFRYIGPAPERFVVRAVAR